MFILKNDFFLHHKMLSNFILHKGRNSPFRRTRGLTAYSMQGCSIRGSLITVLILGASVLTLTRILTMCFFFQKRTQQNTRRSIHETSSHREWLFQRFNQIEIVCARTCGIGVPGHLHCTLVFST